MISDKRLLQICGQFRKGVLGNGRSNGKCFMINAPLSTYLRFIKVDNKLIEGFVTVLDRITNHYWILLSDGRIIDAAADQFNDARKKEMPKVYLGERPDWYMLRKNKNKKPDHG